MNRLFLIAVLGSLLAACASTPSTSSAPPPANAPKPAAAAAPAPSAATDITSVPGMATVVFFRPSKFVGGAIGFIVREGTTELGKLRSGKYFVIHVPGGKHTYVVHSEAADELTIDADVGETYYIEGEIGMGVLVGHPHLKPADKAAFDGAKSGMKQVEPLSG